MDEMNFFNSPEVKKEIDEYTAACNEKIKKMPFFRDKDESLIEDARQYVLDIQFKTTRNGLCKSVAKKYGMPQKDADTFVSLCVDKKIKGVPAGISGIKFR